MSWDVLSDVARRARRIAHGTPALLWLDVPLEATGAADFKQLLKAKLSLPMRRRGPPIAEIENRLRVPGS